MSQDNKTKEPVDYTKWEINGNTFTLDLSDAEDVRRYENAMAFLKGYEPQIPKIGLLSDRIIAYCDGFYKLFDMIFGDGAGEKIFDGKKNMNLCHSTYGQFLAFATNQRKGIDRELDNISAKYGNRATRRAAQKKKK